MRKASVRIEARRQAEALLPFCQKQEHWSEGCTLVSTLADRKKFFVITICVLIVDVHHRADQCRRRCCVKCKYKHHRSMCDRPQRECSNPDGVSLTIYINYAGEKALPAIIPVSIEGQVLSAYLGCGRNFISREAIKLLKLKPTRRETCAIVTVSGTKVQTMSIFDTHFESPDFSHYSESQLKLKYSHIQDKRFYMTSAREH